MAHAIIRDFRTGMDRTRDRSSGEAGTLYELTNAHITRGGVIEKRKKLVEYKTLPSGTLGFQSVNGRQFVFSDQNVSASMPTGMESQQLAAPNTPTMIDVLDSEAFSGNLYVVAEYDDGNIYHFYNGSRVTDWDTVAAAIATDFDAVTERLAQKINVRSDVFAKAYGSALIVEANTAGTAFTMTAAAANGAGTNDQTATVTETQANVAAVAETRATVTVQITGGSLLPGTNRISSITVGGTEILNAAVDWTTSDETTALLVSQSILNKTSTGYTATVATDTVTISAPVGDGATANGRAVVVTVGGDVTVSAGASMSGGVTAVTAVAQNTRVVFGGTWETDDTFSVTIGGTVYKTTGLAAGTGTNIMVHKNRVWSVARSSLRACVLNDPTDWTTTGTAASSGAFNLSTESGGNAILFGLAPYQGIMAVFAEDNTWIYQTDTDITAVSLFQTIPNTGTASPRASVGYAAGDVFYLSVAGIRSLRARDSSNSAVSTDVGNLVDPYVAEQRLSYTPGEFAKAVGAIEAVDGRYWLAIKDKIIVLSYFPGSKISAWSTYDLEEISSANVSGIVRDGKRTFVRSGDKIYLYGGSTGTTYGDDSEITATVKSPFLAANLLVEDKDMYSADFILTGEWLFKMLFNIRDESKTSTIGRINRSTLSGPDIPALDNGAVFAFEMTHDGAGAATISQLAFSYNKGKKG